MDLQRFLILLGLVILITGVMWPLLSRIGLGRLPGDIVFQRGGATFYFPLVTCIIVSIASARFFGSLAGDVCPSRRNTHSRWHGSGAAITPLQGSLGRHL
jgi:hypothetical protein